MVYRGSWYFQDVSENTFLGMRVRSLIFSGDTKYQHVEIVDFEDYGIGLVLDGLVQSTQADEFIYHETLVHPAMLIHRGPETVLIIGGGEGAALREVLRHSTVKRVVMVDIDGELVELAKKYLGVIHQGSFYDPRAEIVIGDGLEYVKKAPDRSFDVVIIDLTDPYEPRGLARELYTESFYREVKRILREDGVVSSQVGNAFYFKNIYREIVGGARRVFRYVRELGVWIPSFGYQVCYILATDARDPDTLSEEELEKTIRERRLSLRYINGRRMVSLLRLGVIERSS